MSGIMLTLIISALITLISVYIVFFKDPNFFENSVAGIIIAHVATEISASSYIGTAYIALIGGLFFIFLPLELLFYKALATGGSAALLFLIFIIGVIISYSLDYIIGEHFSGISRKLVSPKKFYKLKSFINKHGKAAILVIYLVPLMPSQLMTFMLGVFRYDKTRLFVFFICSWILKLYLLIMLYVYLPFRF